MSPVYLFLDFDGVLHPRTTGTFRHAPLLEKFLRQHPEVRVVVSSSWKMQYSLEELRGWFSPDVQNRLVGVTPDLAPAPGFRQREIEAWLQGKPFSSKLALDDEASLFQPGCNWLILTRTDTGLTEEVMTELSRRVGR